MLNRIKDILIGPPLPTQRLGERRLNNIRGLAAFSPGALSSLAYANQEIYLGLLVAGGVGLSLALPIGTAIALLLGIVALSYYQTIQAYPSGGGSYVVAKENLGVIPGLVAAAALVIDYILTAAVSLTAGIDAIASAFPQILPYRISIALFLLLILTLLNLRGAQETGTILALPVYFFLLAYILMIGFGIVKYMIEGPVSLIQVAPPPTQTITLFLILHTFSTGCTAMTGIEAISNGVPVFRPPETRNAGKTLIVMAFLMTFLFLGSIGLTQGFAVIAGPQETILSALSRRLLGDGPAYIAIQLTTLAVLAVAANTSFAGFPRLTAILAKDSFLPRQLTMLGERLVYTNGILILSFATAILIVLFGGDTHALIPLFAVGAFLAFTLSQIGMVIHWLRSRGKGWILKAMINGLGMAATGIAVLVIAVSKFLEGAWISLLLIPIIVSIFQHIHSHYQEVRKELTMKGLPPSLRPDPPPRVVVPISGINRSVISAVTYALSLTNRLTIVYIELEPGTGDKIKKEWAAWFPDLPLKIIPSPYRTLVGPLIEFLDQEDAEHNDGILATVVLPEFIPARWWHALLHNQTAWLIKTALLYRRRRDGLHRVIIDVPFYLRR